MSAAAAQAPVQQPSRRQFLRHPMDVPVDITILRSGVPQTIPARIVDLGEGGLSAVLAGEVLAGQAVGVEFNLPTPSEFIRAKAVVRHYAQMSCGLEFLSLAGHQKEIISAWSEGLTRPGHKVNRPSIALKSNLAAEVSEAETLAARTLPPVVAPASKKNTTIRVSAKTLKTFFILTVVSLLLFAGVGAVGWWQWQAAWKKLEAQIPFSGSESSQSPMVVPPEIMQARLIRKVDPVYPEQARLAHIQGVVVLRVVVGRDGSVVQIIPLSGDDTLAQAATAAVRWWKFDPYKVNGTAVPVETRVSVAFQP